MDLSTKIRSLRTKESTKKQYLSKATIFKKWVDLNHPYLMETVADLPWISNVNDHPEILEDFFGHICQKRTDDDSYYDPPRFQSYHHVNGYKSAILDLYRQSKVKPNDDIDDMLMETMAGYKRLVAELKQNGEMSMKEGKSPLSFEGYRFIAKTAISQPRDFMLGSFAWIFLLLCWNLMARCNSVGGIMYDHIGWEQDAMYVVFPTHKGDQEGDNSNPKHVYANPNNPEICPILALAVYIWTIGYRRDDSRRTLFGERKDAESRFSSWLRNALGENSNDLLVMGILIVEIGTHSFRKGIASFLACLTGGPTAIAIYLRAGWSLGAVQSRYIVESGNGDQLCGRAATGNCTMNTSFAVLPPHFDQSNGNILTVEEWEGILPGYRSFYPVTFRKVCPFLLASIVYHMDWLKDNFPIDHPLFISRLWTSGILERLKSSVHTGNVSNPVTKLCATGVPEYVQLSHDIYSVRNRVAELEVNLGGKIDELPEKLKSTMLDNFQVNGAVPITFNQVQGMLNDLKNTLTTALSTAVANQHNSNASNHLTNNSDLQCTLWTWKGRLHPVPEGFRFPKCTTKAVWDLWWDGLPVERIKPLRHLKSFDLSRADGNNMSKARKVLKALTGELTDEDVSALSISDRDNLFQDRYLQLFRKMYPDQSEDHHDRRRIGDLTYMTVYDLMSSSMNN
jgi:hypothetical protein